MSGDESDNIMLNTPRKSRLGSLSGRIKKYKTGEEVLRVVKEANDAKLEEFISKNWNIDTRYKVTRQWDPDIHREEWGSQGINKWYFTPLHIAIENHWTQGAVMLLNNMSYIDARAEKYQSGFQRGKLPSVSPLMLAVQHNNIVVIKKLISMGCNVNFRCHVTKDNAVVYAVQKGHVQALQCLVQGSADINFEHKFPKWFTPISPLCRAVYYFNNATKIPGLKTRDVWHQMVQVLIDGGANINAKCGMVTVLAMSDQCKDRRVYKLLSSKGADKGSVNRMKRSTSFTATKKDSSDESSGVHHRTSTNPKREMRQSHLGFVHHQSEDLNTLSKRELIERLLNTNKRGHIEFSRSETALNEAHLKNGIPPVRERRSYTGTSQISTGSNKSNGRMSQSSSHHEYLSNHVKKNSGSFSTSTGSSFSDAYRNHNGHGGSFDDETPTEPSEAYLTMTNGLINVAIEEVETTATQTDNSLSGLDSPENESIPPIPEEPVEYDRYNTHEMTADALETFLNMVLLFCLLGLLLVMHIDIHPPDTYKTYITMVTTDLVLPVVASTITSILSAALIATVFIMTMYLVLS